MYFSRASGTGPMKDRETSPLPAADTNGTGRMSIAVLARSGAIAGAIKLSSAGLSFLMFVIIATITDARQFGLYSTTYAGASLVSFFASVGQQSTVLRFWPQYAEANDLSSAHGLMHRAIFVALAGVIVSSLLVLAVGFAPYVGSGTPEWLPLCASAALLSLALAWSEFASGAFRAKGALISGLLPRDVIWRAATIAAVGLLWYLDVGLTAVSATLITAVLLILVVLPQTAVLLRDTLGAERQPLSQAQKSEFTSVTLGLWGVTSLPPALGQVSTLLVAAILGPEIAGAVFVADRTTRLAALALSGINQALAPEISSAFYGGDKAHVQRTTSLTALASSAVAIATVAVFFVFGAQLLGIFDHAYATPTMHTVLIVFGIGVTVVASCGPLELLMQLTGLQNSLLKLLIVVNVVGLAVTAAMTYLFGPVGSAVGITGTVITWNIIGVSISWRAIGINPSIMGLFAGRHPSGIDPASQTAA
ncbi:lipopolysaccharide biosynthesis protein [Mesorhizobium sp. A556]